MHEPDFEMLFPSLYSGQKSPSPALYLQVVVKESVHLPAPSVAPPQLKGSDVAAPAAALAEHSQPFLSQHRWDQHLLQGRPRKGGCLNVIWRAGDSLANHPLACRDYSPASKGTTKSPRGLQVGPAQGPVGLQASVQAWKAGCGAEAFLWIL